MTKEHLRISKEVQDALDNGQPVVALESTIISHGMPYPKNVETALKVEQVVRDNGAIPATIAIIKGTLKVGISAEEIDYLGQQGTLVRKTSRRDIPFIIANQFDGATTVASTMIIANLAGIRVFATGGIGGVHRGGAQSMDISADLEELAQTNVAVICAGVKSILDLELTMEYLETKGVPVVGFGTNELPAFYTRKSRLPVDYKVDDVKDSRQGAYCQMGLRSPGRHGYCQSQSRKPTAWTQKSSTKPLKRHWLTQKNKALKGNTSLLSSWQKLNP